MNIPIGIIARFALKRIVLPAIAKASADPKNPLTITTAKDAVSKALVEEAGRQIVKRAA